MKKTALFPILSNMAGIHVFSNRTVGTKLSTVVVDWSRSPPIINIITKDIHY